MLGTIVAVYYPGLKKVSVFHFSDSEEGSWYAYKAMCTFLAENFSVSVMKADDVYSTPVELRNGEWRIGNE